MLGLAAVSFVYIIINNKVKAIHNNIYYTM